MRTFAAITALLLFSLLLVTTEFGRARFLTPAERATLIGSSDTYTYLNACCQTSSDCVLPTTKQCSQVGNLQCQRGAATDYYFTPNNQTVCGGTWASHICNSSISSVSCVVSYTCMVDPNTGACTEDMTTQSDYAYAATSCTPNCPVPQNPG